MQHQVPVLAVVQQPLRGIPQHRRRAAPEPVGYRQVAVDVAADARRARAAGPGVVVGGEQQPAVGRVRRVELGQVDAAVPAFEHREGERAPRQRLKVGVRQQPRDELFVQAELRRVPVDPGERAHRVEDRVQCLLNGAGGQAALVPGPADPRREHVRHGLPVG